MRRIATADERTDRLWAYALMGCGALIMLIPAMFIGYSLGERDYSGSDGTCTVRMVAPAPHSTPRPTATPSSI